MYKIAVTVDDENKWEALGLYLNEKNAEHDAAFLAYAEDEDGNPYELPIETKIEEATPRDFERPGQRVVIRCRECSGELRSDSLPLFSNLKNSELTP